MNTLSFARPRLAVRFVAFFISLPACIAAVHAERLILEPVTAIASSYERPLATTPASVTVLEAAELAPFAAMPVEDILALRAGVTLARTGGPGQQVSVFLRGTDSDSVLVLVDGVKFNSGTFGGANLQNLRGADIARIEIVRGPRATLYGSAAIGGVIAITTRQGGPQDDPKGEREGNAQSIRIEGGSDNTTQVHADMSRTRGDSSLALGIGQYRTDGDPVTDTTDVTGEHRNSSATLHAVNALGDARVGVDAWAAQGRTQYLDDFTLAALHQDFSNLVVNTFADAPLNNDTALKMHLGIANDSLDQREPNYLGDLDHARTQRQQAGIELRRGAVGNPASTTSTNNVLIAGIEVEREAVDARSYGTLIDIINDNRAVYLHNDLSRGKHQLGIGVRNAVYDSFGEHWTGDANYGLRIGADTWGWLAWGRGFRAAGAMERFGYGGNPALQPETSDSSEIGLRQRAGAHEFTLTGFLQHIDDLIDYPAPTYTATNIARARITGTELGWSWHNDTTRIDTFVTLMDPVDDTTGAQLSRRPQKQLSASAHHRTGALEWRTALLAMDRRDNSAYDAQILPGFAVLDMGLAWTVRPGLVVDGRIENVADRDYALASGSIGDYRMPDRAFYLGIIWQATR